MNVNFALSYALSHERSDFNCSLSLVMSRHAFKVLVFY